MSKTYDPILVTVLSKKFKSITEQMALTMSRTTRSSVFSLALDFAAGILDAKGQMLEQVMYIPCVAGGIQPGCEYLVQYFGDDIHDGDIMLHNDVYCGGNQLQDWGVYKPIFYENKLVGWACAKGHQADSGGPLPGSYNPAATEIWQEALRITGVKILEKGKRRKDVWDMIFANVRFPIVEADIWAMIGTCVIGERGIKEIIDRYGVEFYEAYSGYAMDAAEKEMRAGIASVPDGTYKGSATVYIAPDDLRKIQVAVNVSGEEITFDFTVTDKQSTMNFANIPLVETLTICVTSLVSVVSPYIPWNQGIFRPVRLICPEASLVNPSFPAAVGLGNHMVDLVHEALMLAFAQAVPDKASAPWTTMRPAGSVFFHPRTKYIKSDAFWGGTLGGGGAMKGLDGRYACGSQAVCGSRCGDAEAVEFATPHIVWKLEFLKDSGGAGRWRGGVAVEAVYQIGGGTNTAFTLGVHCPGEGTPGVFGAKSAPPDKVEILDGNGVTLYEPKQFDMFPVAEGLFLRQRCAGGGGWGDPLERPVENVIQDVEDEYISVEGARKDYGVALNPESLQVNREETEELRNANHKLITFRYYTGG